MKHEKCRLWNLKNSTYFSCFGELAWNHFCAITIYVIFGAQFYSLEFVYVSIELNLYHPFDLSVTSTNVHFTQTVDQIVFRYDFWFFFFLIIFSMSMHIYYDVLTTHGEKSVIFRWNHTNKKRRVTYKRIISVNYHWIKSVVKI